MVVMGPCFRRDDGGGNIPRRRQDVPTQIRGSNKPANYGVMEKSLNETLGSEIMPDHKSPLPSRRAILGAAGLAAVSQLGVRRAFAADYPNRPIKIIVPFAPAGPTDIMARILGQNLGTALGGNVIVENRSGAGGNIGIGYAAHAEADGYTLLVTSSAYVVNPSLYAQIS